MGRRRIGGVREVARWSPGPCRCSGAQDRTRPRPPCPAGEHRVVGCGAEDGLPVMAAAGRGSQRLLALAAATLGGLGTAFAVTGQVGARGKRFGQRLGGDAGGPAALAGGRRQPQREGRHEKAGEQGPCARAWHRRDRLSLPTQRVNRSFAGGTPRWDERRHRSGVGVRGESDQSVGLAPRSSAWISSLAGSRLALRCGGAETRTPTPSLQDGRSSGAKKGTGTISRGNCTCPFFRWA